MSALASSRTSWIRSLSRASTAATSAFASSRLARSAPTTNTPVAVSIGSEGADMRLATSGFVPRVSVTAFAGDRRPPAV